MSLIEADGFAVLSHDETHLQIWYHAVMSISRDAVLTAGES
jgi:hypothetical protein